MVGTSSGSRDKFEIVDLENAFSKCKPILGHPLAIYSATSVVGFNEFPLVCGGHDDTFQRCSECFTEPTSRPRLSPSPFANQSTNLFLDGGAADDIVSSRVQILTNKEWETGLSLTKAMDAHYTLLVNSTRLMTIGGYDGKLYLADTYFFNSISLHHHWIPGPSLKIASTSYLINSNI